MSQLTQAEELNEAVHIIGHIAPTGKECTDTWYANYVRIIKRFKSTIKATLWGHTHKDHFYLYPNDSAVAIMSGSITTYGHVNPCYKVFQVEVSDHYVCIFLFYVYVYLFSFFFLIFYTLKSFFFVSLLCLRVIRLFIIYSILFYSLYFFVLFLLALCVLVSSF